MTPAVDLLIDRLNGLLPRIAIVLGSGLGGLVDEVEDAIRIPFADIPGFPEGGVSGHAKELVAGFFAGQPVIMVAGRVHYYEKGDASAMRLPVEALAALGVKVLIDQCGRLAPARHAAGFGDADHGPHQFFRAEPADRRKRRWPLRRHDCRL